IRHAHRREKVRLAQFLELAGAVEQEKELRGQRRRTRALVEAFEKRVLLGMLEHDLPVEALGEPDRETRLADADRAFDDDETGRVAGRGCCLFPHAPAPMRSIPGFVRLTASSSLATLPRPGTLRYGAISASGNNTKFRSAAPGCGSVSPAS